MIVWAGQAMLDTHEPVRAGAVCVEDGRIVAVGTREELHARYGDAPEEGGDDLLLMPALVNSHDHGRGLGTASLGVGDDLLETWLLGLGAQPTIDPYLAAAYDGARLLRSGVGAVAHSHNPRRWDDQRAEAEATIRGYRDVGIRVAFHPVVVDQNQLIYAQRDGFLASLPPDLRPAAERFAQVPPLDDGAYFALCDDLHARFHDAERHTVHIQASPAGGQWCSDELIGRAVRWARDHGTRVQMHMLETRYQRHYARQQWGTSFVRHLDSTGALGPWLTLAHMVWVDPDDIPILAQRGVAVAHNPSSNLRLRSGVAPVAAMLGAGVTVGVGLDGHALDEDQDHLRELRLAWTLANAPGAASPTVEAADMWAAGTTAGAQATFGDAPLGRLAPGYAADLVLLDWRAVQSGFVLHHADPADLLLRRASRAHVRHVMIDGAWVVRDGVSCRLDEADLVRRIQADLDRPPSAEERRQGEAARALVPYVRRFYAGWEE
jgi:5-methylthioadenosine/S-adenosylhomocysteine deaminase